MDGYQMFRNDRKKGGGGLMAYVSSNLPFKHVRPQRNFKTMELLAFDTKIGASDLLIVGIYRPPKAVGEHYFLRLEEQLNFVSTWASMLETLFS